MCVYIYIYIYIYVQADAGTDISLTDVQTLPRCKVFHFETGEQGDVGTEPTPAYMWSRGTKSPNTMFGSRLISKLAKRFAW